MSAKPVTVEWMDAHSDAHGWTHKDALERIRVIVSCGFLLPTSEGGAPGHLTLVQSFDGDLVDSVLHIPLGMVRRVDSLVPDFGLPLEPFEEK
jgi:hypothetical protein